MSLFEYFMVLVSVVLSLALAHLVAGLGELVRSRANVRWSVSYVLWMAVALCLVLDLWTSLWLVRDAARWNIVSVVFVLLTTVTVYLYVHWLLPRDPGAKVDLSRYTVENRRLFLGALIAYLVSGGVMNVTILPPGAFDLANFAFLPVGIALVGAAWWFEACWVQRIVSAMMLVLMAIYFATFFQTIG